MKTGLILLVAAFSCLTKPSANPWPYGTVIFDTRVPGIVDAPIFTLEGPVGSTASGFNAQLFLVSGEGNSRAYTGLTPAATFQKPLPSAPALAAYVQAPKTVVFVPGAEPG